MRLRKKRLLELLAIKKMNQADLARAIGTTPAYISNVLNGRKKLSLKSGKKLVALFGADMVSRIIDWDAMGINNPFGEAR